MRTFAALLILYMRRTGISDSELARTLGVRRQTIFRWKEGLVERPRCREDVLRCADRLRLMPEERDELLLAAGFPPENPLPATVAARAASFPLETPTASPPLLGSAAVEVPPPATPASNGTRPAIPRRAWVAGSALALVILLGGAVLALARWSAGPAYPVAARSETLIVIGDFGDRAQSPPGGRAQAADLRPGGRLQAALEREIRAAGLERVRVALWPEELREAPAVESARRKAGAAVVVGGARVESGFRAIFTAWPATGRTDDLALEALVSPPPGLQVTIAVTATEDVAALALSTIGELYAAQGDLDRAHATLTTALALPPADPETLGSLYLQLGYVSQVSRPPDLDEAIFAYGKAIALLDAPAAYLNRGVAYVRRSEATRWQSDLAEALAKQPDYAEAEQALCWAYALDKQPEAALPHCDAAVSKGGGERIHEARAVVYAELGRLSEAAAELQRFLDWLSGQPETLRARYGATRLDWLAALKAGSNSIDAAALDHLRRE